MKKKKVLLAILLTLPLFLVPTYIYYISNPNYYGMILYEEEDKEEIARIKNMVDKEYNVTNWFSDTHLFNFETTDSLEEAKEKFGKYGKIEDLTDVEYHLF